MPCPHHDIKIIQRSNHQSAVASAAYQSGERLFSEYDQKQKYYSHKSEIVHTEIMLPPHAHQRMQTAILCGTPPKLSRSNGTPSLPGESCLPYRGKSPRNSTPTLSGTTAGSFLFLKA